MLGIDTDNIFDFGLDPVRLSGRQVNLVQHRQDFESLVDCRCTVRDTLRLDALCRIDHEQRAFARRK